MPNQQCQSTEGKNIEGKISKQYKSVSKIILCYYNINRKFLNYSTQKIFITKNLENSYTKICRPTQAHHMECNLAKSHT